MDSRPRNNQGQFAPDEQGGMDPNTTSAAYNPQIIEARKASLAEKLRRAIGLRRGVEESVPQEQRVLSAKLRLRELAEKPFLKPEKPFLKQDEKLMKDGPAKRAAVSSGLAGGFGAGVGALYGSALHSVLTDGRIGVSEVGKQFPKLLKHAKASSRGKYALLGAAAGAIPSVIAYPIEYGAKKSRHDGLKKYPKSVGEIGVPGYTESYPENSALPTLKAYFRKKEMSAKFFGKMEDEDTALKKAGRVAGTAAIGGLAGRMAAWNPVHGGKMNRATMIGAGLGALSQGAFEHIASAKTGLHGKPVNVTDESRKSTRDIGGVLPSLGLVGAGVAAHLRGSKDNMDDTINEVRIRMTGKASDQYAAKKHAQARRAMGLEGETFIPKMPNFSLPFGPKSANPRSVDEIGGGLEQKLERLAKSAKGTPEGEAAARKLNALRSKEGKTFMGKVKKAVAKVSSKFKSGNVAPQKVIGRLLSAKLRLRELSEWTQQEQDAYEKKYAEYLAGGASAGLGRFDAKDPKTGKKYGGVITPDMYKRERQNPVPVMVRLTPAKAGGWDKKITPPDEFRQQMADYREKQKTILSAKLRLRELARQAAYSPYAQAQPAEPGQAGRNFRNAAIGIGALGAGGGVAYASWRGAQAAKSAQTLTDDALKTSGEARKAARTARVAAARFNRAGKVLKTQLTTFPTFKKVASKIFEEEFKNLKKL